MINIICRQKTLIPLPSSVNYINLIYTRHCNSFGRTVSLMLAAIFTCSLARETRAYYFYCLPLA